ncbi:MAG: hypothetical protein ACOYKZ_05150 [Chlamydiia bacterium]
MGNISIGGGRSQCSNLGGPNEPSEPMPPATAVELLLMAMVAGLAFAALTICIGLLVSVPFDMVAIVPTLIGLSAAGVVVGVQLVKDNSTTPSSSHDSVVHAAEAPAQSADQASGMDAAQVAASNQRAAQKFERVQRARALHWDHCAGGQLNFRKRPKADTVAERFVHWGSDQSPLFQDRLRGMTHRLFELADQHQALVSAKQDQTCLELISIMMEATAERGKIMNYMAMNGTCKALQNLSKEATLADLIQALRGVDPEDQELNRLAEQQDIAADVIACQMMQHLVQLWFKAV